MDRVEIKEWAKKKIKGHTLELFVVVLVVTVLTNLTIGQKVVRTEYGFRVTGGLTLGIFFYFVEVGLVTYMINFIKNKKCEFMDIFKYKDDYIRIFLTNLLQIVFIVLWGLLLIIPGIIKALSYALVPFLLADEKYKDLSYKELLNKSSEIMDGHKLDYLVFTLSYIGWHILSVFTLGLLEIWVMPYQSVATHKFLNDIKENYEKKN